MIAAWCFQCGLDYAEDVAECIECGVPTVDYPSSSTHSLSGTDGEQLAYELHAWNGDARVAVERALHTGHIRHAWQGPTLLILEDDEDVVDEIIEVIDDDMTTDLSAVSDGEGGRVGFDLGVRNETLHAAVGAALTEAEIEHEMGENGFLLVEGRHEDQVGDVIEAVQADLKATHTFGPGVDGVDSPAVVESLFVAADVLRRSPRDLKHQRQMIDSGDLAHELQLPFGYEAPMWRSVLDEITELRTAIDDENDDAIAELAGALRSTLFQYV